MNKTNNTNEATMEKTITRGEIVYTVIPDGGWQGQESWFTTHPVKVGDRIEIARVSAFDGRRYPAPEEVVALRCSRYASSNEFHGELVTMMIGVTSEEIAAYGFTPTGKDPSGRRASTPEEAQEAANRLCNEERL